MCACIHKMIIYENQILQYYRHTFFPSKFWHILTFTHMSLRFLSLSQYKKWRGKWNLMCPAHIIEHYILKKKSTGTSLSSDNVLATLENLKNKPWNVFIRTISSVESCSTKNCCSMWDYPEYDARTTRQIKSLSLLWGGGINLRSKYLRTLHG